MAGIKSELKMAVDLMQAASARVEQVGGCWEWGRGAAAWEAVGK